MPPTTRHAPLPVLVDARTAPALTAEDLAALATQARHDAWGTRAANTDRTYGTGGRGFARWCAAQGVESPFPVPPRLLAAFVDDVGQRLKPATVETYLHAVNAAHRQLDFPASSSANVVRQAMMRLRRAQGSAQRQAEPMRQAHIAGALAAMGNGLANLRDAALVSLAYDGLFRASELVALRVRDVRAQGEDATAFLGRSKTDQDGRGDYRFVARETFARVRAWVEAAGLGPDAPLFMPLGNAARAERLTPRDVARIYKRRVGQAFSGHSTRVGAAFEQREACIPTGLIAQAGSWKGDAMARALHLPHRRPGERCGDPGPAPGAVVT